MEVAFETYKKISFQSYLPYETAENFVNAAIEGTPQGVPFQARFFWANGILFRFFNHAPSEALAKEIISGHLILEHIEFAPMPEYRTELRVPTRPLASITVLDVSKHIVFNPLTAWIRENLV